MCFQCCLQGENVACPICHNSFAEHRLKYHMKTSHPGESHTSVSCSPSNPCLYARTWPCLTVQKFATLTVCMFAWLCWTETPPLQGTAVMVKRAEKCPYCDSYFLRNSSEYKRHIWAHQGILFVFFFPLLFVSLHAQSHWDDTDALLCPSVSIKSISALN